MSQILAPGSGITIEAGGQVLAHAAGYSVKMSRACVAVWPYGSTEPLTLLPGSTLPGSTSHILQLEQIRWEEAANYNTMSNFTVKITRNGGTVQYNGCEWTAVEEESRSPLVWQRATLAARQRTEEQNGAAG